MPPLLHAESLPNEHWVATWGAAPGGPPPSAHTQVFNNRTLRLVVHASIGGNRVRVRLSNELGSVPLIIGAAHVAVRENGAEIAPGSDRALTFSGKSEREIPPGAPALSDPVELNVPPMSDLAISIYLPGTAGATTLHPIAGQTSFVSMPGNFTRFIALPTERKILSWPFLTEVDVDSGGAAIAILGDSITDAPLSTPDSNNRWPDWLARRLQALRDPVFGNGRLGVVNRGISANRLLSNPPDALAGRSALERFARDVLSTAGVRYAIVMLGIDDIGASPNDKPIGAQELIAGYRQLIAQAHGNGIAIFGPTLTPFEGAAYYSPAKEEVRQAVNSWIRNNGEFDGVIDFDAALRDEVNPARLRSAYDSGDHLHPNDLGYQAMGAAVPLELFRTASASKK